MNTKSRLNIASVIGVKDGINQIFSSINIFLADYSQDADKNMHLETCWNYVHQLNGLLEMLELNSVIVVSKQMEKLIEALIQRQVEPVPEILNTLQQAADSIFHHLGELIEGGDNSPLHLFPVYRSLMQAQGIDDIAESHLFFNNLDVNPPLQDALLNLSSTEIQQAAKQARSEYQPALLKWLRDTDDKESLQSMAYATSLFEKFQGSVQQRAFWWICSGFFDGILHQPNEVDLSIRRLCGKIEQEMRRISRGLPTNNDSLMREILYQIARCQMNSPLIDEIKRTYEWPEGITSDTLNIKDETVQSAIKKMQALLPQAQENWEVFNNTGNQENLALLTENIEKIQLIAPKVQYPPLDNLLFSMSDTVTCLRTQPQNMTEDVAIEMATALLLINNILEDFNGLSPNFAEKVTALCAHLHLIMTGKQDTGTVPDTPSTNETELLSQKKALLQQASQEMLVSLSRIEKILNNFLLYSTNRSGVTKLAPLFKKIIGILTMLNFDRASLLMNLCQKLFEKIIPEGYKIEQSEQDLLVNGLSSLSFFIEAQKSPEPDCDGILENAIARFEDETTSEIDSEIPETITTEPIQPDDITEAALVTEIEPELLNLYIEEAEEVLAEIATHLSICQNNPADLESLTTIRRGFHTLKGSGRMVNLNELGEIAWKMEQTLDHWLDEEKLVSPQLINLITHAHSNFSEWQDKLKSTGTVTINADELLLLIKNLSEHAAHEVENSLETTIDTVNPDKEIICPSDNNIQIGEHLIASDLFQIYITEAQQHLTTLKQEMNKLLANPDAPSRNEFMLAAHTLSSTSHALGLVFIATPSSALELWLSALLKDSRQSVETELQCAQGIINCLENVLKNVSNQQLPDDIDLQTGQVLSQEMELLLHQPASPTDTIPTTDDIAEPTEVSTSTGVPIEVPAFQPDNSSGGLSDTEESTNPELLQLFLGEARELTPEISSKFRNWRLQSQDQNIPKAILRALHTLKGSAHVAGASKLGNQIHNLEGGVENAMTAHIMSVPLIENLEIEFDRIIEQINDHQRSPLTENQTVITEAPTVNEPDSTPDMPPTPSDGVAPKPISKDMETLMQTSHLRVGTETIDRLVKESAEIGTIHLKVEAQLNNFKLLLQDLTESVAHLHGQLREIEIQAEMQMRSQQYPRKDIKPHFDSLELDRFTRWQELTRLMAENVDDIFTVQTSLQTCQRTTEKATTQQAKMNHNLQQELIQLRTIPFSGLTEHFHRVIRQTARDLNKKANLSIQGDDIEIDRSLLQRINSPLEHLLRNAIAHGIESPTERASLGKPETGQVNLSIRQVDKKVIITLSDDGSGLDLTRIRKQAEALNLIAPDDILEHDQLTSLIFEHGLTTNNEITGSAGRGIGMDVVKSEITTLRGRIEIESQTNQGTTFEIFLPLTLADSTQTLIINAGKTTYAIPALIVERIQELDYDTLNLAYQNHHVKFNDETYPFAYLSHLLGESNQIPENKRNNKILLLRSGTLQLAIHITKLIGKRDFFVKNIGAQLTNIPGVEGATILGEGEIVFMINPIKLLQRDETQDIIASPPHMPEAIVKENNTDITSIMIVDDSLTVRKVTTRLLEREGYNVLVAKDGLDAIEALHETVPDVMLVDLEMPHMNGFELIKAIRNNPNTKKMPIIIISSRTSDKHRQMARELGVNTFLGKPYNEEELLKKINQHLILRT